MKRGTKLLLAAVLVVGVSLTTVYRQLVTSWRETPLTDQRERLEETARRDGQERTVPTAGTPRLLNRTVMTSSLLQPSTKRKPTPSLNNRWGSVPPWWLESWSRSAVHGVINDFVGDSPLFPPCNSPRTDQPDQADVLFFEEPKNYLKNSKNPCWYDMPKTQKGFKCMPYVFLAGVAKCGTTDLSKRLRMHPDMFKGTLKEYHWWERDRFFSVPFREYIARLTGKEIGDLRREVEERGSSVRIFGDFSPSYLWEPRNWNRLAGNEGCQEPRVIHGQHMHHVFPPAKVILTFRHPTPRLYSRFLSRIPRSPELRRATSADFHNYVVRGVRLYNDCFNTWSVRQCAYNDTLFSDVQVRLVEGMYAVFMADWLRVWPAKQMFIMRYEDYGGHEKERVAEVMHFLGLRTLTNTEMDLVVDTHAGAYNSGADHYQEYGPLPEKTKQILDEFYQPFINMFAQLLNDKRFLWQDVPH